VLGRSLDPIGTFMPPPMRIGEGFARHGQILRQVATRVDAERRKPVRDPARFSFDT
jgi:NADPH2:quinone reductase